MGLALFNTMLKQLSVSLPLLITLHHVAVGLGYFLFCYVSIPMTVFTFHHMLSGGFRKRNFALCL